MSCCNYLGICTGGADCGMRNSPQISRCPNPADCSPTFCRFNDADLPVTMFEPPEQPAMPPSLARAANEHIRRLERLEAGRAHLLAISDAPGSGVDKFLDWFTALPLWQQVCYLFGAVLALGLSAVLLVGPK